MKPFQSIYQTLVTANSALRKLLACVCALVFTLLCAVVLWGIVTRYIYGEQAKFTDEAARMLLIMITFFGAAYAFAQKAHIGLDVLHLQFSKPAQKLCSVFAHMLTIVFLAGIMVYGGCLLISTSMKSANMLSSMDVAMWQVYLCVPASGIMALSFTLESLLGVFLKKEEGEAK